MARTLHVPASPFDGATGSAELAMTEHSAQRLETLRFRTHDGLNLSYRHRPAGAEGEGGALVFVHRVGQPPDALARLRDELDLPAFAAFDLGARGPGSSPRDGRAVPSVATLVRDLHTFLGHLRTEHGTQAEDVVVVGQGLGGVVTATWVHDFAPRIRGMVLVSPAFELKLFAAAADPPSGMPEAARRVVTDAEAITVPTQILIAGADRVARPGPQHELFVRLGALVKERHVLPGASHEALGEGDPARVVELVREFVRGRFAEPLSRPSLLTADRLGFTRREADELATPLPALSPRGLHWAAKRASLRFGGLLSTGIRLGHETGFDSGSTLDYVYRNEAKGRTPLGRLIDRSYLDSIGWRGIRQRKVHAEELIRAAMAKLRGAGRPVRIVDIAAGHGRYVLESLRGADVRPDSILLRDYSERNVAEGRALIAEKGLQDVARFVEGNAFDEDDLAAIEPPPTLGIVSGLYELFADNDLVGGSLAGLARAIRAGGSLVYTNQPWHPQLELIARALTSHRQGQAWVMRRRTQAEMDELVERAGFRKVDQRIDEWGIFTVSLAQRVDE